MTSQTATPLPASWVLCKISEVYQIIGGGTPSTKQETFWNGDIPWISSADIHGIKDIRPRRSVTEEGIDNSTTNPVPKDSIIVVTRVGLGKIAIAQETICFSQDSHALVDKNNILFPNYFLHMLSQAVQEFKYKHRGTTIAGVTRKQLASLEIPLPPSTNSAASLPKLKN